LFHVLFHSLFYPRNIKQIIRKIISFTTLII